MKLDSDRRTGTEYFSHNFMGKVDIIFSNLPRPKEWTMRMARARQANEVAEVVIPTTFVDDAELIWRQSKAGKTQNEIGMILGWSRDLVARYATLQKICTEAWQVIVTTIDETVTELNEEGVTKSVTPVTENLLRSVLPLTPAQQLELITKLAEGKKDFCFEIYLSRSMGYDSSDLF